METFREKRVDNNLSRYTHDSINIMTTLHIMYNIEEQKINTKKEIICTIVIDLMRDQSTVGPGIFNRA